LTHSGIIARIIFDFASSLFDADETWLYFTTNLLGTCVMNWGKKARGNPTAGWKLINNIYDTVHIALWSMLLVAIIFFCLFTLPKIRQTQGPERGAASSSDRRRK
jgi:hypothetical protein